MLGKEILEKGLASMANRPSLEKQRVLFTEAVKGVLPPRDQADRTCLYRVGKFLQERCEKGQSDETAIWREVLGMAESIAESKKAGKIRNSWAVFMSVMRKEFGYGT